MVYLVDPYLVKYYFYYTVVDHENYVIACFAVWVVLLLLTSMSRRISRIGIKYILVLVINLLFGFISGAAIDYSMEHNIQITEPMLYTYGVFYCSALGFLINCLYGFPLISVG